MFTFYRVLRAVFQILEAEINQVLKITPNQDKKSEHIKIMGPIGPISAKESWNPSG